jgi:hypothetical protein
MLLQNHIHDAGLQSSPSACPSISACPSTPTLGGIILLMIGALLFGNTLHAAVTWEDISPPKVEPDPTMNPTGTRQVFALIVDAPRQRLLIGVRPGKVMASEDEGLTWSDLGPPGADQGSLGVGPNPATLALHPCDPQTIFYGSENIGGFVCRDNGKSWEHTFAGQGHQFTTACDPARPDLIWAGAANGAWRSQDRGRTWQRMDTPTTQIPMLVHDAHRNRLYAGMIWPIGGIKASDDDGSTWYDASTGLRQGKVTPTGYDWSSCFQLLVDAPQPGSLLARTAAGIYRSDDGAVTWKAMPTRWTPTINQNSLASAIGATVDGHLLVGENGGRVWYSNDTGATWTEITGNLPTGPMPDRSFMITVEHLVFDARDPAVIYAARRDGLYRTRLPAPQQP